MKQAIEWVQAVLGICANQELDVEIKQKQFTQRELQYKTFSFDEKEYIHEILLAQLDTNDAIYVYSQINAFMRHEEIQKGLMRAVQNANFDCVYGSMLELQIMKNIQNFYKEKRELHRKNVQKWKEYLALDNKRYLAINERNKKRIVIVTEQLRYITHAPTQIVLNFSYILQEKLGYEVLMFVIPCNGTMPQDLWYHAELMCSDEAYHYKPIRREYRNVVFKGYQIEMGNTCGKEYSMMLDLIYEYNPIFVFAIAIINPVVDLVSDFTTLAVLSASLQCPVNEGQVLVRLGKMDSKAEENYLSALQTNQKQVFIESKIPVWVENSDLHLARKDNGLPENKFLIAVVGNRLNREIDDEFMKIIQAILDGRENIAFVFIGKADEIVAYLKRTEYQDQIYYIGFRPDLMAVYEMIDLYLNPIRSGGGFSSSMALMAQVPVVTLPGCDVAYNVGDEFIVKEKKDIVPLVFRYADDREFYNQKKKCADQVVKRNTTEKLKSYVQSVMDGILMFMEDPDIG